MTGSEKRWREPHPAGSVRNRSPGPPGGTADGGAAAPPGRPRTEKPLNEHLSLGVRGGGQRETRCPSCKQTPPLPPASRGKSTRAPRLRSMTRGRLARPPWLRSPPRPPRPAGPAPQGWGGQMPPCEARLRRRGPSGQTNGRKSRPTRGSGQANSSAELETQDPPLARTPGHLSLNGSHVGGLAAQGPGREGNEPEQRAAKCTPRSGTPATACPSASKLPLGTSGGGGPGSETRHGHQPGSRKVTATTPQRLTRDWRGSHRQQHDRWPELFGSVHIRGDASVNG